MSGAGQDRYTRYTLKDVESGLLKDGGLIQRAHKLGRSAETFQKRASASPICHGQRHDLD
jgi:hypothetical protein